jgi:hypothetical protein
MVDRDLTEASYLSANLRRPRYSSDVHLRQKPYEVEPLGTSGADEEELVIREEELLEEAALTEPSRRSYTGLIIAWIVLGIIILVVIGVGLYLFYRSRQQTISNQPPTTANLGESCTTLPCVSPLLCETGVCKSDLNGPCFGNPTCRQGLVCVSGQCLGGLFQTCENNIECDPTLVCLQGRCIQA